MMIIMLWLWKLTYFYVMILYMYIYSPWGLYLDHRLALESRSHPNQLSTQLCDAVVLCNLMRFL